jgi:pSer/pThr/pTyr-binding forkhead associated (FHA) protein
MWKLVIEDDEGKRTVVPLTRDEYTVGRKEGNTVRLTERNVSREHAKLSKKNGSATPGSLFVLQDCTSYNGVYVNGLRVAERQDLAHGDLIQIGDYRIVLQDDAVNDETPAPAPESGGEYSPKATIPSGVSSTTTRGSMLLERPNRLVMLAGPTPGAEFPLDRDRLTIGRAEEAIISVNHNSVSRLHCEIHALGEARFEIVDKGSSNGVRVNGADLRRGIIEAGDILELGDVKFKFVGAGQIFLPGVGESQKLESIGERSVNAVSGRRTSSLVPFFVVGGLTAMAVLGVLAYKQHKANDAPVTSPTSTPTLDLEQQILQDAKRLCVAGSCEQGHDKIIAGIAEKSPLRESDDFRVIELTWADEMLKRGDADPDPARKRVIFQMVAQATTVDPTRRKLANDKIVALDDTHAPTPVVSTPQTTAQLTGREAGPRLSAAVNPPPVRPPSVEPSQPVAAHPPVKPPTPAAPQASFADQARALMLKGDADAAKQLLMPRFALGKASREEVLLLKTACKNLHDQVCVDSCKSRLETMP